MRNPYIALTIERLEKLRAAIEAGKTISEPTRIRHTMTTPDGDLDLMVTLHRKHTKAGVLKAIDAVLHKKRKELDD